MDLGSGNGRVSYPFFDYGYEVTLVDKDKGALEDAKSTFDKKENGVFTIVENSIEDFSFVSKYDGIILSNVLSFQKDKDNIKRIVNSAFESINTGGFYLFHCFWAKR